MKREIDMDHTKEELRAMKRADLQKLCKKFGIKANMKVSWRILTHTLAYVQKCLTLLYSEIYYFLLVFIKCFIFIYNKGLLG